MKTTSLTRKIIGIVVLVSIVFCGMSHAALIHHWTLDELDGSSQFVDLVGGANGTTNLGAALDTIEYRVGLGCVNLDGTDDDVTVGQIDQGGGTELTVAAWIFYDNTSGEQTIVSQNGSFELRLGANQLAAAIHSDVGWNITDQDGGALRLTNNDPQGWTHVAMVYSHPNLIRYINGLQVGPTKTISGTSIGNPSATDASIGSEGGAVRKDYFDGHIDDVRIYDHALTQDEMLDLVKGLANHWKLDGLTGAKYADEVGPNHGQLVGSPTLDTTNKKIGAGSVEFVYDNGDILNISQYVLSGLKEISLSMWFKVDGNAHTHGLFGNSAGDFFWKINTNGELGVRTYASTNGVSISAWSRTPSGTISTNVWIHATMVFDSRTAPASWKLYLNGVNEELTVVPTFSADIMGNTPSLQNNGGIGSLNSGSGDRFDGHIDDVAVRRDALSADEVKCLFDVGDGALGYDAGQFDKLKLVHEGLLDSVIVGGLVWIRGEGLSAPAGLSGGGANYKLVMDATALTGVQQPPQGTVISIQ
jgi:hypothetical protein